ncbi:MAG: helix-turn-helix transcriptional regulator [Gammaproteobacteria bacterium]
MTDDRIIRMPKVVDKTGYSPSTIYRLMDKGEFPKGLKLTENGAIGWLLSEVDEWILARSVARDVAQTEAAAHS